MKKIFSFTKKKKHSHGTPDNGSVLSAGYDLKDKDLGKVHKAALQGDLAKLKQLAKKNDINQLDKENRTALHIACASGHVDVVHFLVESKAKLNLCDNQNRSALMKAVQGQHERCVNILLENHADPNLVDINGNTALHLAANIPSSSTTVLLLQHGAEINAQNKEGFTPLTVAVREDHIEMAEFLLKEAADVNSTDQDQRSPLMLAAGNGQISMVKLLLQFDADITLKDAKGWSADDYAVMNGHHPCSLLIIEHGTQRTDRASGSHHGPSKKKKVLGSTSQEGEAGFSLGGPATDRDDFEDNSQSESLSRVSKSAADDWPSSEDEDESVLPEKKTSKVNLNKMIGAKKGQGDSSAEKKKKSSNKKSDSQEEASEEESEEEVGEEDEDEEEEEEEEEEEDEDEEDDDEEEEDEEDEEDDEEEEDEDEESEEGEEEDGSVEEDDGAVAAVQADPEDLLKPSVTVALKTGGSADAQNMHGTDNTEASAGVKDENDDGSEKNANAETENCATRVGTSGTPVALAVAEDCVVSAIRVESKFSDEDESLGKEGLMSRQNISNQSSLEGDMPSKTHTMLLTKGKEEGSDREMEKDNDDSWKNNDSGDQMWNDSDNEEDNKTEGRGISNLIAHQRNVLAKVDVENPDSESENDPGSHKKAFKGKKRRSSWGSSLEGSDTELPKEAEKKSGAVQQESEVQAKDTSLPSAAAIPPKKDQPDSSWDSSSPVAPSTKDVSPKQAVDVHKSFAGPSLVSSPHSKSRPGTTTADESEWDSSQNIDSKVGTTAADQTKRQQKGSWDEENRESIDKGSSDPSPVVSPEPEDENTTGIQTLNGDDDEPDGQSSQVEEKSDTEKKDSSWDDDDSDVSEKQKPEKTSHSSPTSLQSLKTGSTKVKNVADKPKTDDVESNGDSKQFPQSITGEKDESSRNMKPEEAKMGADKCGHSNDDESSEDSDSEHQNLQYDFASATVKTFDVKDDSSHTTDGRLCVGGKLVDDTQARLTAYVPLQNKSTIVTKRGEPSDNLSKGQEREPAAKDDDTSSQHNDPLSDEVLPQTDIDDVDVDSPDEAVCKSTRWHALENVEEPGTQKEDSTEDEEEQLEEGEEEDVSDENNQPEDSRESPDATSPVPEEDVHRDKKRDFLSELGLEKGEEEQDEWDSESNSENSDMPLEENLGLPTQTQETSTTEAALKENLFYIPSFLRRKGDSRMAELEPRRSVGRPKGSQGEAGNNSNGNNEDEPAHRDEHPLKGNEKAKWEPVLSKHDVDPKKDLMEELGLGDVDDLEDVSDWDSASTASKRTLPSRRTASPGLEEFPEGSTSSVNEEVEDVAPAAPTTPQRSISSEKRLPSTPSKSAPQPQPRTRTMVHHKSDSEEESNWESDKISPGKTSPTDNQLQKIAAPLTLVKPSSPKPTLKAEDTKSNVELDEQDQEKKDDAVDRCEFNLNHSGQVDDDFRGQSSPEDRVGGSDDVPWEKRYEKLWVEVEKKEVKSTFKSVAGELKERFGELFKSKHLAENATEEATSASTSAEEESSDEEEGEVIVRPTARARSTVLLTIPEQRESGLEDSVTESPDNSLCEERMEDCEQSAGNGNKCQEADYDFRSAPPQLTTTQKESTHNINQTAEVFRVDNTKPVCDVGQSSFLKDGSKQHVDQALKDDDRNDASSEDKSAVHTLSQLLSQSRRPDVPDQELEGDVEGFKLEVGMMKNVFFNSENEKTQLRKEAGRETTKTAMEDQKSSASWDSGGIALEEGGSEKPETGLGCLSNPAGGIHQEQPVATKSTNRVPAQFHLPLQQSCNSKEQEMQAVKRTLQMELVRGALHRGAPQTKAHVNGDPLSVFDDSSLSDVSDDEGRLPTVGQQKTKNSDELDMAEDFDELTQSSETASDDIDSPTSGYRHASLLIQKLDSAVFDSTSIAKLQNIFHEYERSIQKARSRHGYLTDKANQLEIERAELKSSLEEVKDVKSVLERNQLELQNEVTNLKFQLKQEQENHRNATMMYNTGKDVLRKTEQQHQLEVQERQKVELTLRNLELEMRTLINNMKQLEEDHSETQRLLAQERSARTLQENLLNSHLRKQQEIEEENKRNMSKSNEALSQLTEASDRERELLQQISALQEQLTVLRTDLERSQANGSLKESHLLEENEALKEQLEDVRRDLKLANEAVTQTVFSCNNQLTALKNELTVTTTRLENERHAREVLEVEVESTRSRLAGAVKEAELRLAAHSETEKALLREREDHHRLKDRLTGEAASQRETANNLSQKLTKAEAHANSMENELHRVTLQLTEKGLLLDVLQRERDQASARVKDLETTLQAEREAVTCTRARQEATQERLAQAQSESMLLRQQLEEAQNKGVAKERAVTDAQERFSDILSKLRSDCEERVQLVEDRNKELASKAADLRDQIYKLEEEKNQRETNLRQLQQELADSLKKLSMSEASLEVNTRYRNDLEEEKARLIKDLERLKGKLEESEDQYVQAERRMNSLKSSLDEREKELVTAAQKLQEALSTSAASGITIKQLEEAVQKLEIENARLEAAAKQQSNKIDALQKGAQEASMVRGRLEDLVTNLQSSKMTLEDQLSREVQKQSMLSHTAQDSQALWEEELKSRSKLGLRLAELEKEKGELSSQMEIEKKKAKKITEQKKAVDTRLDQEMKRNTELQKEMYRLRTLLKTAKKKLRDQDAGGAEFSSPVNSLRVDQGRHSQADGGFGRIKDKVDDLQVQLDKETSRRSQLEKINVELKDQVASLRSLSHSNDQLERSKRQLEEEVLSLRRRMEAAQVEQSQVEQFRREADERARQEIQQKLEQVNLFLQSQAASQEALDQIKAANEANLRSQLEHKIRELEGELGRSRTTQQDSLNQRDSTRTELERYRQLYTEELRLRKSLAAKLDRANSRLAEANSKLLSERSRSLITGNIANGSLMGPSLDLGSLGSPANYAATIGPLNRSLGLGLSLLSPATEGQNSRVEDYLAKMQSELDRNISKELSNATAELDAASARMSPVGSASRVELDPLSRATQQYLEVLKKNNRI